MGAQGVQSRSDPQGGEPIQVPQDPTVNPLTFPCTLFLCNSKPLWDSSHINV